MTIFNTKRVSALVLLVVVCVSFCGYAQAAYTKGATISPGPPMISRVRVLPIEAITPLSEAKCLSVAEPVVCVSEYDSLLEYYMGLDIWYQGTNWTREEVCFVLTEDISAPTELSRAEAELALVGEMKVHTDEFLRASEDGVKFEMLATVTAMETGHFKSFVWKTKNNPGGIIKSTGEYATYNTPEEGISALENLLTSQYISPEGRYFVGEHMNVMGLAKHYNTQLSWIKLYVDVRLSQIKRIGATV